MTKNNLTSFPWGHARPFNSYAYYIKERFGGRIQKISIHGNFTCPNRDGTKGVGGCAYCNNDAFITAYCTPENSISQQIKEGKQFVQRRYRRATQFFAYLQAYSNTYAPLERITAIIDQLLQFPEIVGIIIGTRPDCVDDEKLAYFKRLSQQRYVLIEYGVESVYDDTLQYINRGHDFAASRWAIEQTAAYGIPVGAHLILGFPNETETQILQAADIISELPLTTLKLHQLQIVKNTRFAEEFRVNPERFSLFTPQAYIPFVADFVTRLSPHIMIERFAGDTPRRVRVAPAWEGVKYERFVQLLEEYMCAGNLWQGKNWKQVLM